MSWPPLLLLQTWKQPSAPSSLSLFQTCEHEIVSNNVIMQSSLQKIQWHKHYCWWLKSCTTWDVSDPVNNGINYQPQLVQDFFHLNMSHLRLWLKGRPVEDDRFQFARIAISLRTPRFFPKEGSEWRKLSFQKVCAHKKKYNQKNCWMKLGNHTQHMPRLLERFESWWSAHEYDLQFPLLPCAVVEGHTWSLAQTCQKKTLGTGQWHGELCRFMWTKININNKLIPAKNCSKKDPQRIYAICL